MRLTKIYLGVLIITAMMQICAECYCDDGAERRVLRKMEGEITAVDTFNSSLSVEWQDTDLIHYDTTTFIVPEGMTFYKGTDTVDILDINVGDRVTIEYYMDDSGTPKMVSMNIAM